MIIRIINIAFYWGKLLLIILLIHFSGATEGTEAFQWSRILEEASKPDDKAPLTNILTLFGDDSSKQHELENNNQIREDPPMVNINYENSPRVHPADPQTSSLYQPSIEERFGFGANGVQEYTGFRDSGSHSGHISLKSDLYSLEHPHITTTHTGNDLHYSFSENLNQINRDILPKQMSSSLTEISADINNYVGQSNDFFLSSIEEDFNYEHHHKNHLIKHQNGNHHFLDSGTNYQDYNTHFNQDMWNDIDRNHAQPINEDYSSYFNHNINVGNQNFKYVGQSIQEYFNDILNPSHENILHLKNNEYGGLKFNRNADLDQQFKQKSMQKKRLLMENDLTVTSSEEFQHTKKVKTLQNSEERNKKKTAVASKYDNYMIESGNRPWKKIELNLKEKTQDAVDLGKNLDNQAQHLLELRIKKYINMPKIKKINHFINKALLSVKMEKKMEVVNYALEYFLLISKLPYMASKEDFLKEVSSKRRLISRQKNKKGSTFFGVGALYIKGMQPNNLSIQNKDKWTFALVLLEIQSKLGFITLSDSGFGHLPEREAEYLKIAFKKLNEESKVKIEEINLNKIVKEVVLSLVINVYHINVLKQTASYFGVDSGIEENIGKNWNQLASYWHNLESLDWISSDKLFGAHKEYQMTSHIELESFLKAKKCLNSSHGNRCQSYQISLHNFETWFTDNYRKLDWFTQPKKNNILSLQMFMKDFCMADWWERYNSLSYKGIDNIPSE
ncbi:expressed protein [Phakopsora pachyrhizi]|uniref:Expressed protein n=1 Tax=Phakopsora pachyrhizi TaxID=170000 RepID=A0AAV0AQA9_PHAPC|nr:expressed protein [Phakopsora pachyrhizi]